MTDFTCFTWKEKNHIVLILLYPPFDITTSTSFSCQILILRYYFYYYLKGKEKISPPHFFVPGHVSVNRSSRIYSSWVLLFPTPLFFPTPTRVLFLFSFRLGSSVGEGKTKMKDPISMGRKSERNRSWNKRTQKRTERGRKMGKRTRRRPAAFDAFSIWGKRAAPKRSLFSRPKIGF